MIDFGPFFCGTPRELFQFIPPFKPQKRNLPQILKKEKALNNRSLAINIEKTINFSSHISLLSKGYSELLVDFRPCEQKLFIFGGENSSETVHFSNCGRFFAA
jgi:hypothetical protein